VAFTFDSKVRSILRPPVACTSAVWAEVGKAAQECADTIGGTLEGHCLDLMRDVLHQAATVGTLKGQATDRVYFAVDLTGTGPLCKFCMLCGPGDTTAPVFTLMMQGED
jgi:hypothetical protein